MYYEKGFAAFANFEDRGKGLGPRSTSGLQKHKKAQNKMLLRCYSYKKL